MSPLWMSGSHSSDVVLLFIVFPPLPRWGSPPSKLPKYRYLLCSHPCPGGARRSRSYQRIAIYHVRAPAQVGSPPSKLLKYRCFSRSPPAQVGLAALEVTKVSLFIVSHRSGSLLSKLSKYCYWACPCPCPKVSPLIVPHPCSGGGRRPRCY